MAMGRGETFQIISFGLLVLGGLCVLAGTILGFWGSRISDKGYLETIGILKTHVEAARKRQEPAWTPFKRIDASNFIPPTANFAIIQFKLWSEDNTVPLMIRIASSKDGLGVINEVAGPSGVVTQMLTEKQAFYISFSHPNIKYEVIASGWKE
ncbi:MAG: hypothetical protein M0P73_02095 [Syntrophobacterales bacterium]|jgi:hypothetical protein|nr:hypothetical protein [Syntrophobacterales bacterium]